MPRPSSRAFKTSFDFMYQEALRGRAGAMDVIVHAELGGRPNIAVALRADDPLREAVSGPGLDPAPPRGRRLPAVAVEPAGGALPSARLRAIMPPALITGAGSLIGEAIAQALAAGGWNCCPDRHRSDAP